MTDEKIWDEVKERIRDRPQQQRDAKFWDEIKDRLRNRPEQRLYRAMYVLSMHKGRPHAAKPAFRRKWLTAIRDAAAEMLAELPPEEGS